MSHQSEPPGKYWLKYTWLEHGLDRKYDGKRVNNEHPHKTGKQSFWHKTNHSPPWCNIIVILIYLNSQSISTRFFHPIPRSVASMSCNTWANWWSSAMRARRASWLSSLGARYPERGPRVAPTWSDTAPTMTLCYSSLNKARLWPFIILELYLRHDSHTQIRLNNVAMLVGSTRNASIPSLLHQRRKCGD